MSEQDNAMDRNLALEAVRVTEAAALAASRRMGRGDERSLDQAAVEAMRSALNSLHIDGRVVIGEGEEGEVPALYVGERVGAADGPRLDVALDALEGTTICAKGGYNVISVVAMAQQGGFLSVPEVYMDKIAVGPGLPEGVIDLDGTPAENLRSLALAKGVEVSDLLICMLDRPRHEERIAKLREAGARIMLIGDGDVSGVVAVGQAHTGVDMFVGIGGAPEGVLAAAALRCIGGQMQGRLVFRDDDDKARGRRFGITDFKKKYDLAEMADGDVMFAATGVTSGPLLRGARRFKGGAMTHSLVMRSKTGTLRYIEALHNSERKAGVEALDR